VSAAPEGFREVWVPDQRWRVVTDPEEAHRYRCRWGAGSGRRACGKVSVAAIDRHNGWWRYCGEHLYGHRIQDGQVLYRRTVKLEEAG